MWEFRGRYRPSFAIAPGEGQESVWDFPRPPAIEPSASVVEVRSGERLIARSSRGLRLKETASPPTYYLPAADVDLESLLRSAQTSVCEWKGVATYWALAAAPDGEAVAWRYERPSGDYAALAGHFSFYPGRVACFVDGERVRPQPGGFYGGWVTDGVVGPFKGEPGTGHW